MRVARVRPGRASLILGGLVVVFGLAAFASPFASSRPDGLNKVAADHGFDASAHVSATQHSPVAGYTVSDVENEKVAKGSAGVVGVAVTLLVATLVFGT